MVQERQPRPITYLSDSFGDPKQYKSLVGIGDMLTRLSAEGPAERKSARYIADILRRYNGDVYNMPRPGIYNRISKSLAERLFEYLSDDYKCRVLRQLELGRISEALSSHLWSYFTAMTRTQIRYMKNKHK